MNYLRYDFPQEPLPAEAVFFNSSAAQASLEFHRTLPGYAVTPLVNLPHLAKRLDIASLVVKDERTRFGLNSFKGLGGSRLAADLLAHRFGLTRLPSLQELGDLLKAHPEKRVTLCTATDGNHGRGVAWSARALGLPCFVYLPKGAAAERVANIRTLGATTTVTDVNYDDTVAYARAQAHKAQWVFVQDTDDENGSDTVRRLMQGYLTLAEEIRRQIEVVPTHVFLQAGVGSFAGATAAFFAQVWRDHLPHFIVVEAQNAACIRQTAALNDGRIHSVTGDLQTMMAGLSCGTPCRLAWKLLSHTARHYVTVTDGEAAQAMRILGNPLDGDTPITAGESGAAGVAALLAGVCVDALRKQLNLTSDARVLCINTEGDTDQINYRRVVWNGIPTSDLNF